MATTNREAEKYSTFTDAAKRLHKTPETLHRWRAKGYILATKLPSGRYLIPESELERLLSGSREVQL